MRVILICLSDALTDRAFLFKILELAVIFAFNRFDKLIDPPGKSSAFTLSGGAHPNSDIMVHADKRSMGVFLPAASVVCLCTPVPGSSCHEPVQEMILLIQSSITF